MPLTVHTVYCDDIRFEQQGKVSIIGTFGGAVLLPAYPATLPKLCVVVSVMIPLDIQPKQVRTVVCLGDDELKSHDVTDLSPPSRDFPEGIEGPPDVDFHWVNVDQYFVLSPLVIDRPKALRVKVFADGEEYKGAALYFIGRKEAP
ncbi:hypothetical protein [Magnetospirillum sp. 64-120]|uniref:DUF6941 family protein n=1 Tax=Magnetospirillum sp. 64-120 TaxID=1895778 RepID=UPI00092B20CA|nr:hypothetical protein [Magnetospirillum sp. 64-120]OJX68065.1 MAG: hypothetical protein BGO92_05235 [Magnetospirillum sp. 64-120]